MRVFNCDVTGVSADFYTAKTGRRACVYVSLAAFQTKIRLKKKSFLLRFFFSGANDVVVFVVGASAVCNSSPNLRHHTLQLRCVYSVQWLSATNVPRDFELAHA